MTEDKTYKKGLLIRYPKLIEDEYSAKLVMYVKSLKISIREYILNNKKFIKSYEFAIRGNDVSDDLDNYIKSILAYSSIKAFLLIKQLDKLSKKVNTFSKNIVSKYVDSAPLVTKNIKKEIKMWLSENVDLIMSISVLMLAKVKNIVHSSLRNSDNINALKKELSKVETSTDNRAKLIARDQIGKLNSRIVRQRHLDLGIQEYQWITCQDEKVRPSHRALSKKICSWNNVDIYKLNPNDNKWKKRDSIGGVLKHPEEDFNCRCTSIAIIPNFLGGIA